MNVFALFPPAILNRVESELKDFHPVKTNKTEKYRFHCFIDCIVEVTCTVTVIILESMFWKIKSVAFTYGGIEIGEFCCWAGMFVNAQYQPP